MYEFLYSLSYVDIKSFLKEVRSDVFKVIFLVIFFVIFIRIMMKINKNVIGTKKKRLCYSFETEPVYANIRDLSQIKIYHVYVNMLSMLFPGT